MICLRFLRKDSGDQLRIETHVLEYYKQGTIHFESVLADKPHRFEFQLAE